MAEEQCYMSEGAWSAKRLGGGRVGVKGSLMLLAIVAHVV